MVSPAISVVLVGICLFLAAIPPSCAATFRQYDPNLTGEMNASGLLDPISPEHYEKEMTSLNASMNTSLGCDDFPRCDPTVVPAPISPLVALASLFITLILCQKIPACPYGVQDGDLPGTQG
ncbi:MAG TPA: hypothetical protein VHN82_06220 [Methanoregula sp.]|nr:hypothetical protein [Methanoregula sp.]